MRVAIGLCLALLGSVGLWTSVRANDGNIGEFALDLSRSLGGVENRRCEPPQTCTAYNQGNDGCGETFTCCGASCATLNQICYLGNCSETHSARVCGRPAQSNCQLDGTVLPCGTAPSGTCTVGCVMDGTCADGSTKWRCTGNPCGGAAGPAIPCNSLIRCIP